MNKLEALELALVRQRTEFTEEMRVTLEDRNSVLAENAALRAFLWDIVDGRIVDTQQIPGKARELLRAEAEHAPKAP